MKIKKMLALSLGIFFLGFSLILNTEIVDAQLKYDETKEEEEPPVPPLDYEQDEEVNNDSSESTKKEGLTESEKLLIAEKKKWKTISNENYTKASKELERLQNSPEKNHRKYLIALNYLKKYLSESDYKDIKAGDINMKMIRSNVYKAFLGTSDEEQIDHQTIENYKNLAKELEYLANLFHDAQLNTVKEIRASLPNGGILPGSRNTEGSAYVGETVIPKFINTLLILTLSISTLLLMVGGGMYVFSSGDDELKKKAKDIFFWTISGTGIMIIAYALVKFVININFEI